MHLLERFRLVPGARFYAWPVYFDMQEDRFTYEADGWHLVSITEAEEGGIVFSGDEWEEDLLHTIADHLCSLAKG